MASESRKASGPAKVRGTEEPGSAPSPAEASEDNISHEAAGGLAHRLYTGKTSYDFVGNSKRWYKISAVLLIICVLGIAIRGLNLGIEFTGGADFQVPTKVTSTTVADFSRAVTESGVPDLDQAQVTTLGDNTVRIQTRTLDSNTEVPLVRQALANEARIQPDQVAYSLIGASWGKQITQQGIIALVVFLALVMVLIWVYFRDLKMSLAAITALLHDLVITIGIYAIVGFTFTPSTLIGMLTILGYSLYDTLVVFDKVRENTGARMRERRQTYGEAANMALNQVLVRSVNTTIIGVLPVIALLVAGIVVLGTGPLKDLGLVLLIGMIAGAYSSLFIATPMLNDMKRREPALIAYHKSIGRTDALPGAAGRSAKKRKSEDAATADEADATETTTPPPDSADPADTVGSVEATSESEPGDAESAGRPNVEIRVSQVHTQPQRSPRQQPRNQPRSKRRS
ncbi:protein translocase subunit SecF [Granulicoccus phenolivorans]|uniref:protein translocase subunit SecF n=1 Tax=Granulicoccus phenolivorans TaxID=266854 RepID=UPI0004205ED7|nr:protein translocase subunit SecF [Granulicoccus phenolivorans]